MTEYLGEFHGNTPLSTPASTTLPFGYGLMPRAEGISLLKGTVV